MTLQTRERQTWTRPTVTLKTARRTTVIISGFHRSGTSLFAEYLQKCGLFIGYNVKQGGLLPSGSRTGHHEDQEIAGFQYTIAASRGISNFATHDQGLPIRFNASETEVARKIIAKRRVRCRSSLLDTLFPFLHPAHEVPLHQARLVICSVFAPLDPLRALKQQKGTQIRIVQFTGESRIFDPCHDVVDFTIGSDHEGPQDCVCPLSLVYYRVVRSRIRPIALRPPGQRKFCVMVGRHLPLRHDFYHALSGYRQVDGYGRMFGRPAIGRYWDQEFLAFLSEYKFVICFENDARKAYHTEKIINPILAGCVPVYWGSSSVKAFISPGRFLMLEAPDRIPELIARIRDVDQHDARFESMVLTPPWARGAWEQMDAEYGCQHAIGRLQTWLGIDTLDD